MKPLFIVLGIVAVVVLGWGLYFIRQSNIEQPVVPPAEAPLAGTIVGESLAEVRVAIKDFKFTPATITVKKGTKITWTNNDSAGHTVTADSGSGPNSALLAKGQSYSFNFDAVGSFSYHCTPHPFMKGMVQVVE